MRRIAKTIGWGMLAVIGWLAIMALYITAYNLIEQSAVPVTLGSREFETDRWDAGFFHAKGSYRNDSAVVPGDELPLQTEVVDCDRSANTCTIASADVFDHFLNVDVTSWPIASWTDKQITFGDDSAVCATNAYVIDRAAESMTLLARKKAVIPDYALKSPLHPCDNLKDKNITLADGFKVYWYRKTSYEQRNGLYFHLALIVMNLGYLGLVVWLWRRRRPVREVAIDS